LTTPMYLRTLGGLRLEGSEFRRPKPLLLLTYLALEGAKTRRYLAELFFMDANDQMNSLSRALSYLRQEVPGVIEVDNKKVWATVSCDAAELLSLTDSKQLEKCLELYKGAFAVDYDLELSEELEEWLYGTREILAGKARNAFLSLGESEAAKGNFSQAAQLAEKAYKLREAREVEPDDFGRLYNLLYAGNSPLASEVRKEAEGFEIPLQLSRVEAKAQLSETVEATYNITNNLPLAKTTFVGRDQELIEIAQQLAKPECRLLTLHGMGGIGKSRTAIQVAYDQVKGTNGYNPSFTDGVYFIALDALTSADMIPSAIVEVLDFEMQGIDDVLTQVQKYISKKKILLILDNFEHLMDGAILPSALLSTCPELKIIVTTREVLKLEEEWVKNLEGLHYPTNTNLNLEEAQGYEAVQLFMQRAKRTVLEFSASENNIATLIEICQLVEGAPLALELAATWVRVMTLEDIAKEIKRNLSFLESQSRNGSERHQSIRAVFEHSWKLLTAKEQEVFRKLAVFVGSFSREAAAEVAGATLPVLASLVNKSLLRVMQNGRYSKHFLISEFIQDKLNENGKEFLATNKAHGDLYFDFVLRASDGLSAGEKMTLLQFDEELGNIYRAWSYFLKKSNVPDVFTVINSISYYFSTKIKPQEGIDLFTKSQTQFESQSIISASLNKATALLLWDMGQFDRAKKLAEQSLAIFQKFDFPNEIASLSRYLGIIHVRWGQYAEAKSYFEDELRVARQLDKSLAIATALDNLGLLYMDLGYYAKAEECLQQSYNIYKEFDRPSGLANALHNLGSLFLTQHKFVEANEFFQRSLILAKEIDDKWLIPYLLIGLANVAIQQKCFEEARKFLRDARSVTFYSLADAVTPKVFLALAKLEKAIENYDGANQYLRRALSEARKNDAKPEILNCLLVIAELYLIKNNINPAVAILEHISENPATSKSVKDEATKLLASLDKERNQDIHNQGFNQSHLNYLVQIVEDEMSLKVSHFP
jgi:predicted ATPase